MVFLSMLMFRERARCVEKALFPLGEPLSTSRRCLSCCLKSYSTLDRQTETDRTERLIGENMDKTFFFVAFWYISCVQLWACQIPECLIGFSRTFLPTGNVSVLIPFHKACASPLDTFIFHLAFEKQPLAHATQPINGQHLFIVEKRDVESKQIKSNVWKVLFKALLCRAYFPHEITRSLSD